MRTHVLSPILALGLGCGLTACGAMARAEAEQTRVVLFSPSKDLEVSIDGGEKMTVSAGRFRSVSVGPGKHEIAVTDGRSITAELDSFDRLAVPLEADQCFFGIDVTMSHYSADGSKALGKIDVADRRVASEPFEFPPHTYLTEDELPKERTSANLTYLLRSLPCAEVDRLEGKAPPQPTAKPSEPADDAVAAFFGPSAGCEAAKGAAPGYCKYGKAWATAKTTDLPDAGTYVGVTLELKDGQSIEDAVAAGEKVSFFAVARGDAPAAWITTLSGDNDDERAALVDAEASVKAVIAGQAEHAEVGKELAAYLATMPDQAEHALVNGERSLTVGDTEVRRSGNAWLTRTPADGSTEFSIHVPYKPKS